MTVRRLTQMFLVCLAFSLNVFAQNQGASFLLQLPGAGSGNTRLLGYLANTNDLTADVDATGPSNAYRVIATPSGSKFYILNDGNIQILDAALQTFTVLNGVPGPFPIAKITPDGKYLLLGGTNLYLINTQTNAIVATNLGLTGTLSDVAVTADSKKAWVLQQFGATPAITPINLTNLTTGTRLDLPYGAEKLSVSPLGILYTSSSGRITEYNPDTLTVVATLPVIGNPSPLKFSPDGSRAFFLNTTPQIGARTVQSFRTAQRDLTEWPPFSFTSSAPVFEDLLVASNDRIFAYERANQSLWEITASPLGGQVTNLNGSIVGNQVYGVALSNEVPSARFLYVLTQGSNQPSLRRINLSDNTISINANAVTSNGVLQYIGLPPQTGAANILKFNDAQVLASGGNAKPLIFQVTDGLGRPVFNQTVTVTSPASLGITIGSPSSVTNSDGFSSTDVSVPNTPGTYTFNVDAGSASTTFTVTVPGAGGGGSSSTSLLYPYRGNGQVVREFTPTLGAVPMTARLTDEDGNPLAGVAVSFEIVEGGGALTPLAETTDDDGQIATDYQSQDISQGITFERSIIRATSEYGTADFYITTVRLVPGTGAGSPNVLIQQPTQTIVNVGRGDVIKDFAVVQTTATRFPQIGEPIPHVGLRIGDGVDATEDGPAACVNDTLGDNLGVSRCDLKTSCDIEANAQIFLVIGEFRQSPMTLVVGPGLAQQISVLSGDSQTGNGGQLLPGTLAARVTDNCGTGIVGKPVIWTVTQGSATLSQVSTVSGSDGRVTARVTLGSTPGPVTIRVAYEGAAPAVFHLNNQAVVSSISLVSGNSQTATIGTQFASPLVFVVRDVNNNPVGSGLAVNFTITGVGTLGAATANTDANGRVQVAVTAGATAGAISVTATTLGYSATANLSAVPVGLNLTSSLFTNAASGAVGLVPCGLVTISAPGLAPNVNGVLSGVTAFGPLPYLLGPIDSITVNGIAAPIQAVSNQNGKQQVNFQAPCEVSPGSATVVIRVSGQNNTVTGVPVLAGQPGIFTYAGPNGKAYGAVIRLKDGTYITPSNPAVTGENYWMVLTGMGQTTPALTTNSPGIPNQTQTVNLQTQVGVNNAGVPTQPAKYLPGATGVYYVEFTIPKGTTTGTDLPLAVFEIVNGQVVFGNPVYLPALVAGP